MIGLRQCPGFHPPISIATGAGIAFNFIGFVLPGSGADASITRPVYPARHRSSIVPPLRLSPLSDSIIATFPPSPFPPTGRAPSPRGWDLSLLLVVRGFTH